MIAARLDEVIEQNFLDFSPNLELHWQTFDLRSVAWPAEYLRTTNAGIRAIARNRPAYCWGLLAAVTTLAAAATSDAWWYQPMRTPVIIGMGPWLAVLGRGIIVRPPSIKKGP